ncbi:hypothetical protein AB0J28_03440 [Streptosporangium canum]|uniref:hypothetical protein n=1 Tax=Streptosporangium canum TaxID=324952 RepID=UPI003433BAFA
MIELVPRTACGDGGVGLAGGAQGVTAELGVPVLDGRPSRARRSPGGRTGGSFPQTRAGLVDRLQAGPHLDGP